MNISDKKYSVLNGYDIGKINTGIGFFKTLFHLHDSSMKHCLPAIVKGYDRSTGIVNVLPLVKTVIDTLDGTVLEDRPTYNVPMLGIHHGGFTIDIPVFVGDTGWIIAGDRDSATARKKNSIENLEDLKEYSKDGNEGPKEPDTRALGDFSWGFFIPDYWGRRDFSEGDGMIIRYTPKDDAENGTVEIKIGKNGIEISRGSKDKVIIGDDGPKFLGKEDRMQKIVTDIRYDLSTHQLQKRTIDQKIRGDFVVGVSDESGWTMIDGGQAVPETV